VKGIGEDAPVVDVLRPSTTIWLVPFTGNETAKSSYEACRAITSSNGSIAGTPAQDYRQPGLYWWCGQIWAGSYNHTMPPNSTLCTSGNDNVGAAYPASSRHPGVVNVAFADGSVKTVKETVNVATWWAIATRAGREVVSSDGY
jgi:prepilin-type processing-associated H-X9-DG protein